MHAENILNFAVQQTYT